MASLREFSIGEVGAMGVPFMFMETERTVAMLNATFACVVQLIFMICLLYDSIYHPDHHEHLKEWPPWHKLLLCGAAVMVLGFQCFVDMCKGWRVQQIAKTRWYVQTVDSSGEGVDEAQGPLELLEWPFHWLLIYFDGFIQPFINFIVGGLWLCMITKVEELLVRATVIYFVCQLDYFVVQGIVHTNIRENSSIKHDPLVYNDTLWQLGSVFVLVAAVIFTPIGIYITRTP